MNSDGTALVNLTNNPAYDDAPAGSPDGTKIAFSSARNGNSEIYVMNSDGTGVTRLTNTAANNFRPTWSPDGTKLAFVTDRDGAFVIYTMNADGSDRRISPRRTVAMTTSRRGRRTGPRSPSTACVAGRMTSTRSTPTALTRSG